MKASVIDRGFYEEILRVDELLPEFGDLDRHSQDKAASRIFHLYP